MNLIALKKKNFKIVTNWQECNKKSIFLFDSKNKAKFINYVNLAIKKNCKFVICHFSLKKDIKKNQLIFSFIKIRKI